MVDYIIIIDNGHGTPVRLGGKHSPPLKDGTVISEPIINRVVASQAVNSLISKGVDTRLLVPEIFDISLQERVRRETLIYQEAKKAGKKSLFLSVHFNALHNYWNAANGLETWYFYKSKASKKFAEVMQSDLVLTSNQKNRGIKGAYSSYWKTKIYILRYTKSPAILVELGFMDNKKEVSYMLDNKWLCKRGIDIANSIFHYIKYKL